MSNHAEELPMISFIGQHKLLDEHDDIIKENRLSVVDHRVSAFQSQDDSLIHSLITPLEKEEKERNIANFKMIQQMIKERKKIDIPEEKQPSISENDDEYRATLDRIKELEEQRLKREDRVHKCITGRNESEPIIFTP